MKYFVILLIIAIVGGAIYLRTLQPKLWNQYVDDLKVPGALSETGTETADGDNSTPSASSDDNASAQSAPRAPAGPVTEPEIISPSATNFMNPDHTRPVEQPSQPGATSTPETNAPAAQTPATNSAQPPAPSDNPAPPSAPSTNSPSQTQ